MRLRDFLRPEHVILDLRARTVEETIAALVSRLRDQGAVTEDTPLERLLLEREAVHTTALGDGVAIPHATVPGLGRALVLVAVSPDGVAFGPTGLDPVRIFFLVLSPEEGARTHIKLLARLCRLVRHPGFIEGLRGAETAEAVLDAIERVDRAHV
ncbi:MAG: PTS sugar transporter subunit IIA [Gemmatimonadota bacterium]